MERIIKINDTAFFEPYLLQSLRDQDKEPIKRPLLIVIPGGSYTFVSPREGQPVALKANTYGYHAVVLSYTTLPDKIDLSLDNLMNEFFYLYNWIQNLDDSYQVDKSRIFAVGFSAGGHLASWASIKFPQALKAVALGYGAIGFNADEIKMAYDTAVEQMGGIEAADEKTLREGEALLSLMEQAPLDHLSKNTPPTFLFHTMEDSLVPVRQSIDYARKLNSLGVAAELHCYGFGEHGLSLADNTTATKPGQDLRPVETWFDLAMQFFSKIG